MALRKKQHAVKSPVPRTAVFYGSMKWFDVEIEDLPRSMPRAFTDARKLYAAGRERNINRVIGLLQPFAHALFLPYTLPDWEQHFADVTGDGMPEIEAAWVRLCGVDFENGPEGPFPLAKMEAQFSVPVTESFDSKAFGRWQEENDVPLYDAVSFLWRIPSSNTKGKDRLFAWQNNQGTECLLTNRKSIVLPKGLRHTS